MPRSAWPDRRTGSPAGTSSGQPDHPPGEGKWDQDAVYKPYAIFDGRKWLLWYNGRRGGVEQIGLATHEGEDLGF